MSFRLATAAAACIGAIAISPQALALGLTTQDCLDKGQCAYVSPTGHVSCGKCPGQLVAFPWALAVPDGVTALCADNNWSMARTSRACFSRGGVKVLLKQ
jgi:hypothetical protein